MKYSISDLNEKYDLQLEKVLQEIKKQKAKLVLLQFPDGLKPYATAVVDYLEEKTNNKIEFLIWMESCYGACDLPVGLENIKPKIDLTIQFGHNELMPKY
jgi:2-(3-amino-3-carboxypropyl)histidine synthase